MAALFSVSSLIRALESEALDITITNKIVGDTIFPSSGKRQIRVSSS
jgi:hypothetical protein